jgi:hypothetical protein
MTFRIRVLHALMAEIGYMHCIVMVISTFLDFKQQPYSIVILPNMGEGSSTHNHGPWSLFVVQFFGFLESQQHMPWRPVLLIETTAMSWSSKLKGQHDAFRNLRESGRLLPR